MTTTTMKKNWINDEFISCLFVCEAHNFFFHFLQKCYARNRARERWNRNGFIWGFQFFVFFCIFHFILIFIWLKKNLPFSYLYSFGVIFSSSSSFFIRYKEQKQNEKNIAHQNKYLVGFFRFQICLFHGFKFWSLN